MIIDTHAHIIVPELVRPPGAEGDWRPGVYYQEGRQIVSYQGKQIKSALRPFADIDGILSAQEAAGVDCVLLCPWVNLLCYETGVEEGLRTSRIQNESLSRLAAENSNRLVALGTVPLQDPELSARELEVLMKEPGLFGVEIASSVNGAYLGDDRFRPFWAAAEENGALVFIHPTTQGFNAPVFKDYYLWNTVGNPLETTITAAHMVMAGVMEDHPGLKVLLAHGGGAILSLRGRLQHASTFQPQARSRLEGDPQDSLKRFYYDTLTHDLDLLRELVAFAGPDHVMVGSDYPFDMGLDRPADAVRKLGLPSDDEEKILSRNASRLLDKEY